MEYYIIIRGRIKNYFSIDLSIEKTKILPSKQNLLII